MSQNQTSETKATNRLKNLLKDRNKLTDRRVVMKLGIGAFALLLAICIPFYVHAISHESTDDAFIEAHVTTISPRVSGHVAEVLVADNQIVEKGEVLARLDPRDFQVALDAARARLESARAAVAEAEAKASAARNTLEQKRADLESQYAGIAQAKAEVAEVKAGHDRDRTDLARMKQIADAGAVSKQEYDHARAAEEMARAKLNSSKRYVDTQSAKANQAKAGVYVAQDELNQAVAQVNARTAELHEAEADVEQARLNLSYAEIKAPCNGFITKKAVEPGAYTQVGQKLFSIVSPGVWVVANYKETQLTEMQPGQSVEVEVDTYPGVVFNGHVDSIQRGTGSRFSLLPPENATGNFIKVVQRVPVKIVIDDAAKLRKFVLAPGMSVIPSVDISSEPVAGLALNSKKKKSTVISDLGN